MSKLWLVGCCVSLLASLSLAQDKVTSHWDCSKPSDAHSIDVGDRANHTYVITKSTCAGTNAQVAGLTQKDGVATQFNETMGNTTRWHGIFVATAENGDKAFYSYSGKGTLKDGQLQSGSHKWSMTGGTGKFAGGKSEGTCQGKGGADGTAAWDCEGTYTGK